MNTTTPPTKDHKLTKNNEFQTLVPTKISPRNLITTLGAGEVVVKQSTKSYKPDKLSSAKNRFPSLN